MERSEFKVSSPRKFYGKRLTFEVRAVILSAKMDEKFQVWGVTVCTMGGRLRGVGWSCVMVGSSYTHTYARYSNTQKQVLRIIYTLYTPLHVPVYAMIYTTIYTTGSRLGAWGVPHPGREEGALFGHYSFTNGHRFELSYIFMGCIG